VAKGLTRERIVEQALEMLDEVGIDGLTVRALAARLGVRAPALYWHVRDKQELLDEMGTQVQRRVLDRLVADPPTGPWPDALTGYAHALRAEYLAHRDGARTFAGTRLTDPDVLRAQEPWLARWADDGPGLDAVVLGTELVTAFVVGFVVEEQERAQSAGDRYDLGARTDALADAPLTAAAGRVLYSDPDERFERHLATILRGLR
jgi:AcrR family transcriptional regulator